MVFGSLGQAAHAFSNLFPGIFALGRRHAGLCVVVETIMQGVVQEIKAKQRSFGLNNCLAASGLKCKCLVWQEPFKGTDAKIIVCVLPVRRDSEDLARCEGCLYEGKRMFYDAKTCMCKRFQFIA